MIWALAGLTLVVLCFSLVVFVGPPYLPTLNAQAGIALELLALEPGDTLLELGCGDGKILRQAARAGLHVVGYELNPILAAISYVRTWRYRKQVRVVWGDFWRTDKWPPADGIFGFILPKYMKRLDNKIVQWQAEQGRPVSFASFAFPIPGKTPTKQDPRGVYLYEYRRAWPP